MNLSQWTVKSRICSSSRGAWLVVTTTGLNWRFRGSWVSPPKRTLESSDHPHSEKRGVKNPTRSRSVIQVSLLPKDLSWVTRVPPRYNTSCPPNASSMTKEWSKSHLSLWMAKRSKAVANRGLSDRCFKQMRVRIPMKSQIRTKRMIQSWLTNPISMSQ